MKIGIYAKTVNHFVETLAYFISLGRDSEVFLITDTSGKDRFSEHPFCLERLRVIGNIRIVSLAEPPREVDRLYFHAPGDSFLWGQALNKWLRKTKNIGCLSESHYRQNWKKNLKALLYSFPYCLLAHSAVIQDEMRGSNSRFFTKEKCFYSPSVHPQFFVNKDWGEKLFNPKDRTSTRRTFRFAFIGTESPPEREALLGRVKRRLNDIGNVMLINAYPPPPDLDRSKINILWIGYGHRGSKRGLNPAVYAEALGEIEFSICPLGWGGNWTHRVTESLLRGAIPVLEDADRYNIGLRDMENCIAVKNGNWDEAIARAHSLSPDKTEMMRSNIDRLRENYLLPEAAALRLRKLMRLE